MIIILTLCWILLTAMAVSCGIREGRYREREAIKRAWSQSQLATHDWLNGHADELPTIADND